MTRFVLYGGKGGVGKTTCAAATGIDLADAGHETLVLSTDPAHSLADAFGEQLSGEPRQFREHLWLAELDPADHEAAYRSMAATFASELREVGIRLSDEDAEEILLSGMATGGEEIAALDTLAEYAGSDRFEYVVLDTAPTGHTLRLLSLPEVLETAMETTLKLRGQVRRLADSARQVFLGPYYYAMGRGNGNEETDEFVAFRERMERVGDLLRDPERTEFRVVTQPESMVIRETERLVARLDEAGIAVRTIVVNGLLAEIDEDCARCRARRDAHRERLDEIRRSFPDREIVTLPELETEVDGPADLEQLAGMLALDERR